MNDDAWSEKDWRATKMRLSHSDDNLQSRADVSWKLRFALLGFFLVLLHVGVAWGRWNANIEDQILAFIVFIAGLMLLELDSPEVLRSNSRLVLIFGSIWFNLLIIKGIYLQWTPHDSASMAQFYFLSPCTFAPFPDHASSGHAGRSLHGRSGKHACSAAGGS